MYRGFGEKTMMNECVSGIWLLCIITSFNVVCRAGRTLDFPRNKFMMIVFVIIVE